MEIGWTRRAFLAGSGAAVGAVAFGAVACGGDDDGDGSAGGQGGDRGEGGDGDVTMPETSDDGIPTEAAIYGWISQVFDQGIRRPGYPADEWAEGFIADHFRAFGLEDVRLEPVTVQRWEPTDWSLEVTPQDGEARTLECFPVPFSAPADGLEAELAAFEEGRPDAVAGKVSLVDVPLLTLPANFMLTAGDAPADVSGRAYDPDGTLEGTTHTVPFGSQFQEVMEPSIEAGATAFVGALTEYPGDSFEYFVPYDGIDRDIPGVWVNATDAAWLHEQLAAGPVQIRLTVESTSEEFESHNVVGELPGADDEVVMIGSHHDGPWASAVEDGSGISLVLAQAAYWAAQPAENRPHRLVFLLQGGHMSGGAGLHAYIEEHRDELEQVVLEVHLEHAALEYVEEGGELRANGLPVPRWWFTSRIPRLEEAVVAALADHDLRRSMIVAPNAFGDQPPTDGAFYHNEGVPIVQFLSAPFYLFDRMDTLDKIDRESLVPLSRATIQIVESTADVSAAQMREGQAAGTSSGGESSPPLIEPTGS